MSQKRKGKAPLDKLTFGKYVLDSLSVGMYSHPLMSLREYIQNSADAIDGMSASHDALVEIVVDGRTKSLAIKDDGMGIPFSKAKSTLLNIGCSEKDPVTNRGFRGIGRLGGLAYCDELKFVTKSHGESIVSSCTWDCKKLRQSIADPSTSLDTESLINDVCIFTQQKYTGSPNDHFFTVEMNMIYGGRNDLLNVPAIKSYLSQIAPVPFHPDFSFRELIDKELSNHVKSYRTYHISVNGQQIYKPYRDVVSLSQGSGEPIRKVIFLELSGESGNLGFGWLGELSLQGTVSASSDMDGLRLRYGNLLIGDKDTLSGFFREKRFNNYLVGEIHVCGGGLIPNSRRDDFEDSKVKDELCSTFIREVGIPLSRKIRYLSSERSKVKSSSDLGALFENAARIIKRGYISELQRDHIIKRLDAVDGNGPLEDKQTATQLLHKVMKSQHILSVLDNQHRASDEISNLLTKTLEIVYAETSSRVEAERMIDRLYKVVSDRNSRDTIPVRPTTNQVLFPQNTCERR